VVLLNVWALVPAVPRGDAEPQALHRDFSPRGFAVVAVSIDDAGAAEKVRDFVKESAYFDVLHDPGRHQRVYATTGVPENFVIGADGWCARRGTRRWNSRENRAL
jgi:hypothetical protein